MKKILIVDDEVQILKALARTFLETDYEIFTAENGMEALKLLEGTEIDMIISDMRMPVLDGYKLLSTVKEKYPKIIRIILSGYAEEKPMFKALLHNVAKLYVFKPWNNNELLQNINKLFTDDNTVNSQELMAIIKDKCCIWELPDNCEKMISHIEQEDMDSLILELQQDKEISELLNQVVKYGIYGVMPDNLKQAVIYIGLPNMKCFIHWACAAIANKQANNIMDHPPLLLKHAYLTNRIFLFLYEALLHKQPPEATMFAGLLHNIGFIVLANGLFNSGSLEKTELAVSDFTKLEDGEYKINHQEVGAYLLDQWDLPFPIYEASLYHHRPTDPFIVHHELVSAIHIAQSYAWKSLSDAGHTPVEPKVFEGLGITAEDFEKRLNRYLKI